MWALITRDVAVRRSSEQRMAIMCAYYVVNFNFLCKLGPKVSLHII